MINLHGDWDEVERELDRLENLPSRKAALVLDAVLESGFKEMQAETHVRTGSLKGSEKKNSKVDDSKHQWEGNIEAGGPSIGVNNPVNYAIYEKARGEDHDFTAPLALMHPKFITAIQTLLRKS